MTKEQELIQKLEKVCKTSLQVKMHTLFAVGTGQIDACLKFLNRVRVSERDLILRYENLQFFREKNRKNSKPRHTINSVEDIDFSKILFEVAFCGNATQIYHLATQPASAYPKYHCMAFLNTYADYGDIRGDFFSEKRRKQVDNLANIYAKFSTLKGWRQLKSDFDLIEYVCRKGGTIRAWVDNRTEEQCAFLYLMSRLQGLKGKVLLIRTSDERLSVDVKDKHDTPERTLALLPLQREITEDARKDYAKQWENLKKSDYILRVYLDGAIMAVPDNFYDPLIYECMQERVFSPVRLWGEMYDKFPHNVHWQLPISFLQYRAELVARHECEFVCKRADRKNIYEYEERQQLMYKRSCNKRDKGTASIGKIYRVMCKKHHIDSISAGFVGATNINSLCYEEAVKAMKSGHRGKAAKKFFEEHPDGIIDCSYNFFVCDKCGEMRSFQDLSMYLPKEGYTESPKDVSELAEKCTLYAKFPHKCPECNANMTKYGIEELKEGIRTGKLCCAECGGKMEIHEERVCY